MKLYYPQAEDLHQPKQLQRLNSWESNVYASITLLIEQRKSLSEKQLALWWKLHKLVTAPNSEATRQVPIRAYLPNIIAFLSACPLQRPKLTYKGIVIKKNSGYSRWPEDYTIRKVVNAGELNYLGNIKAGTGQWWRGAKADVSEAEDLLQELEANPVEALQKAALEENGMYCIFCSRELAKDESRAVGYGPDCAEHYNMPYPSEEDMAKAEWEDM